MKKLFASIALVSLAALFLTATTANAQNTASKGVAGKGTKMCCKDSTKACTGPCKDKAGCKGDGKCSHVKDGKGSGCASMCKGSGSSGNTKEAKMCIMNSKAPCTNCNPNCKGYSKTETKSSVCPHSGGSGCPKASGSGCSGAKKTESTGSGSCCPNHKKN